MTEHGTPESILTALRYVCRDDDGMLYAPIGGDARRPYVYLPGYGVHAGGEELHVISVYPASGAIEVLAGNGYTLTDGPLVDMIRAALARD